MTIETDINDDIVKYFVTFKKISNALKVPFRFLIYHIGLNIKRCWTPLLLINLQKLELVGNGYQFETHQLNVYDNYLNQLFDTRFYANLFTPFLIKCLRFLSLLIRHSVSLTSVS